MRRRYVVLVAVATLPALVRPAWALWSRAATVDDVTYSTATLAPPAAPAATASCVLQALRVEVTWTATTSTFADGYEIFRRSGTSAYPASPHATVTGSATGGWVDDTVSASTTYHYRVRTLKGGWRSAYTPDVSVTTAASCLL